MDQLNKGSKDTNDNALITETGITNLRDFENKVHDAIISIDTAFSIKSWNRGAEIIYGYTFKEAADKDILALLTRDYPAELVNEVLQVLETTGYWQGELKQYNKSHMEIWTLVSATTLKNEKGSLIGYVLVGKDITQRIKLEKQLKQLNEHLEKQVQEKTTEIQETLERISDGFVALDKRSYYTYVNCKAEQLLSRLPGSLIGKHIWTEFPEAIGKTFHQAYIKAVATQQYQSFVEYELYFERWLEASIYPSPTGVSIYFRDVSESKKTELALIESEERYRSIVETAQEGIWQIDENNITTFVNNYLASLLGYTADEMIGKSAIDFINEENKEQVLRNVEERKKGIATQHELSFLNRQKQSIHALIQSTPLFKDGEYAGSISMLLDITQRQQAEKQLMANEKRFRALIENSSDGIVLLSRDGIINYISPSGERIIGYTKEELLGENRLNYIHPDDQEKVTDALANIATDAYKLTKVELRYKMHDGSYKWLESNYSSLLNDLSVNALVVNFRDITERKNAERQLQKNERELSLIYNNTVDAMCLLSIDGINKYRYLSVNTAYTTLTGIERDKAIDKFFGEIFQLKNIDLLYEKFGEAIRTGQIIKFTTSLHVLIVYKTAEITVVPIKNEEAKVVQLLVTANDITEQRRAQEDLIKINSELRNLASHLQNIREEERTNMAREVHDELGQQLTALKMDIVWLNKKLMPQNEQVQNKLKGAIELIDRTIGTVRKISSELRPSILDDLGLAEAIDWQCMEFTKRTGIHVQFSSNVHTEKLPPDASIVIFRILQEALTNIARHANATNVVCTLEKLGHKVLLTISDDGSGFDINMQSERKTLGLLGMKERVTMLNGLYNIVSEVGKGTTVFVSIPLPM